MGNSCGKNTPFGHTRVKISENDASSVVWDAGSFSVFPEEVWECILDRIPNSSDVHAVLLAFPELDRCFHSKKVTWMIDQVLPQLMTKYLINKRVIKSGIFVWKDSLAKDLLKLRLVSKRWKRAVDLSMLNHVDNNPSYPSENVNTQQSLIQTNSFNYDRIVDFRLGAVVFEDDKQVENFIEQMENHHGNPFPARSVYLIPSIRHYTYCNSLVAKCVHLFEKFGKHVLSLEIEFCGEQRQCHFELCQNILKCLSHVPNLKSLTFNGKYWSDADQKVHKFYCHPDAIELFPDLPNLQIFNWRIRFSHFARSPAGSEWVEHLLRKYAGTETIRKLGIDQHSIMLPYVSTGLTGLTELHLQLNCSEFWVIPTITNIFENLPNCQQIQTLCISTTFYFREEFEIVELISALAGLSIRNLVLEDAKLVEEPIRDQSHSLRHSVLCIKYLYVKDDLKLSYEFLKLLPNLEVLHIYFDERSCKEASEIFELKAKCKKSSCKCTVNFRVTESNEFPLLTNLRLCILGAFVKRVDVSEHLEFIWKKLPNLKMLKGSVESRVVQGEYHYGIWNVQFARECGNKVFIGDKPNWRIHSPYEI